MPQPHARFAPEALVPVLATLAPPRRLVVAASGGLDSTVLVHALASLRPALAPCDLRVVHVDHGLHPDAPRWAAHCVAQARALGLDVRVRRIAVATGGGASPEAAARDARYAALAEEMAPGDVLLTAHHADDQLETLLLALVRGAGVAGLAAMPAVTSFGPGKLVRPLLPYSRAALADWARAQGLAWCDDPSNVDTRYARNYIRHEVVPALLRRWPAAAATASRSAALCAEASELADALADIDLAACARDGRPAASALAALPPARARNALRAWLAREGVVAPPRHQLEHVLTDVVRARRDALPRVAWGGIEVRRHRDRLYVHTPVPSPPHAPLALTPDVPLDLAALGVLTLVRGEGPGLAPQALAGKPLEVRFRRGGERLRPFGRRHRTELKKLLQAHDVVPWMRASLPLVYAGERLAAVADLWIEHDLAAPAGAPALRVRWEGHPPLR
jgi:tRNA(Ile)-lysidine synthase